MCSLSTWLPAVILGGFSVASLAAQDCPARPVSGTVVQDPYSISSKNGVLSANLTLAHSIDQAGYTHYCYKYNAGAQVAESPTLRVNPGDTLNLEIINRINPSGTGNAKMNMASTSTITCADSGEATINSTNVHFHGLNIPPVCHQDDVIDTLIQPGSPGFTYKVTIPATEPPGLYWYHPHVHGYTEFQVNGGAAGAIVVGGIRSTVPRWLGLPNVCS